MTPAEYLKAYGVKPACEGMQRKDVTALLSRELVRVRLERRNAYAYWAHEVEFQRPTIRVDFVQFEPYGSHTYTDAAHVERGTFTFYEVKSCMADLKSGHGLNFYGDENFLVMPVEVYEPYLRARWQDRPGDPKYDKELARATQHARPLLYGIGRNGSPTFKEAGTGYWNNWLTRARPASEILMCMMRALIANSDHAAIDHRIERPWES